VLLRQPALNFPLRWAVRPFSGIVPVAWLSRLPVVGTVRCALPSGAQLRIRSDGRDVIASALFWRGLPGWEAETFAVLHRVLPHVRVFFDVGASTGVFTLVAALEDPARRVFAFEPTPDMSAGLARNVALNEAGNVTRVEAAVCDHDGRTEMFIPPGESLPFGASTLPTFREPGTRLGVAALRLDTFVEREGIGRVDLVKLDTEGTETEVLAGARHVLERDQPLILCEVLHGLTEAGLHAALDPLGYRYFAITRHGLESRDRIVGDPTYRERNWLFATPRRLDPSGLA
jgi:FkbM family methyltransferase